MIIPSQCKSKGGIKDLVLLARDNYSIRMTTQIHAAFYLFLISGNEDESLQYRQVV